MLTADILGPDGFFAKQEGYEHRTSQLGMAEAVENLLSKEGVLLVEAGTGTGKTLAYLVPAVLSGQRVIISTGTRALQDQIMSHDVPLLESMLGEKINICVLKGMSNYLCLRRYNELQRSPRVFDAKITKHLPLVEKWNDETQTGDRAEIEELSEDALIWSEIQSNTDTRIGPKCKYYRECFVTQARMRAEKAQIIVVNHHLFFADLVMRDSNTGILPDYDAVVFDEAHQVEDTATLFFGVQVSNARVERLVRDAQRALDMMSGTTLSHETGHRLVKHLLQTNTNFFQSLPRTQEGSRLLLERSSLNKNIETSLQQLDDALEAVSTYFRNRAPEDDTMLSIAQRSEIVHDALLRVSEGASRTRAAWVQSSARSQIVGASPIDVSEILREQLLYKTRSIVFTSATLTTSGNFSYIKSRLGINFDAIELILSSPFDYQKQAALYVAKHLVDPRKENFISEALKELFQLVDLTNGGAFVLTTSLRMMKVFSEAFRSQSERKIWVQGEAPKHILLDRFREDGRGVLFATSSFWEGVDVPGHALRLVIMDRLPFDVPTDPLISARCAQIEELGESSFKSYLLPSAAISLKQGFGRLIRTKNDYGIVAILDSRIARMGYGKVLLASLPDAKRCDSMHEVRSFYEHITKHGSDSV